MLVSIAPQGGSLVRLASYHHAFGSYGYHHAYDYGGGSSWITHMVVSSVIHGLIYSVIFRLVRHLSLGEIVVLAAVGIWAVYAWNRNRNGYYRRW